jgi:hypothetical protein
MSGTSTHDREARHGRYWLLAWGGACALGIVNGAARQAFYEDAMGDRKAHAVSTGTLVAALTAYVAGLQHRWPLVSRRTAIRIGAGWAVATLVFEFGFGHYVGGQSWTELLEAYDVPRGELWILVPVAMLTLPEIIRRLDQRARVAATS